MDHLPDKIQRFLSQAIGTVFNSTQEKGKQFSARPDPAFEQQCREIGSCLKVGDTSVRSKNSERSVRPEFAASLMAFGASASMREKMTLKTIAEHNWHAFVIVCKKHNKMAVTKARNNQAHWLPFIPVSSKLSRNKASLCVVQIILSNGDWEMAQELRLDPHIKPKLIEVRKIELPSKDYQSVVRCLWYVTVDDISAGSFTCCQDNKEIVWLTPTQIGLQKYVWSEELCIYAEMSMATKMEKLQPTMIDVRVADAINYEAKEFDNDVIQAVGFHSKDFESLYSTFIRHCFPAMSMSFHSFKVFMTKYVNENTEMLECFFNGFDQSRKKFIGFKEFTYGICFIDKMAPHNKARMTFMCRAYDTENKGTLTSQQLRKMMEHIDTKCNEVNDDSRRNKLLENHFRFLDKDLAEPLTYRDLSVLVGRHKLRGTSKLLRLKITARIFLNELITSQAKSNTSALTILEKFDWVRCLGCMETKPQIFEYPINVTESSGKVTVSNERHKFCTEGVKNSPADAQKTDSEKFKFEAWNIIEEIQKFAPNRMVGDNVVGIFPDDPTRLKNFFNGFITLYQKTFEYDTQCVYINSPSIIVGDIHGNLADLLTLEKNLWKNIPLLGKNLVFLGDYVDRGHWGLESFLYVLALKALMPDQVTLLRGNHEVRHLQLKYSFMDECVHKFGPEIGPAMNETINNVMDMLPISAVIDGNVFCAHGGIPHENLDLKQVRKLPSTIPAPNCYPLAWEILWSDPVTQEEFLEMCCNKDLDPEKQDGFIYNIKRDAGYVFNEEAIDNFFAKNNLTHVVRAHQAVDAGFDFNFSGKCLTIFSCSHYCGKLNTAAVLSISNQRLTVLQIDTTNNPPATDS